MLSKQNLVQPKLLYAKASTEKNVSLCNSLDFTYTSLDLGTVIERNRIIILDNHLNERKAQNHPKLAIFWRKTVAIPDIS